MLTLSINTSNTAELILSLDDGIQNKEKKVDARQGKAQMILPELEDFLKSEGKSLKELTEIRIHTGPGSFTGLRVGATIARTLSGLLHIPINGLPPGSLPKIEYGEDKWNLSK